MASNLMVVRVCPTCSEVNGEAAFFCVRCKSPIGHVEPSEPAEVPPSSPAVEAADAPAAPPSSPDEAVVCTECNERQPPRETCRRCGVELQLPLQWFLAWPWNEETLIEGKLEIGRDSSPDWLRRRFEKGGFDNLSRRHAVLAVRSGEFSVADLGSMNGTFVNDKPVSPRSDVPVQSGDALQFAADLRVTVRSTRGK